MDSQTSKFLENLLFSEMMKETNKIEVSNNVELITSAELKKKESERKTKYILFLGPQICKKLNQIIYVCPYKPTMTSFSFSSQSCLRPITIKDPWPTASAAFWFHHIFNFSYINKTIQNEKRNSLSGKCCCTLFMV